MNNKIEIYQNSEGVQIEVQFENESVWLTQEQLSELFERDRTVIGRHIRNIFNENELDEKVVCANFAHTTQHGAIQGKTQQKSITYYNLDVIISVGYRVKSVRGVQFRQWATNRLKEYLLEGYIVNKRRLAQKELEIKHLKSGIQILSRAIEEKANEFEWLSNYAKGLQILDDYDHQNLDIKGLTTRKAKYPKRNEYQAIINQMKSDFDSNLFGLERNKGFESAINQIAQYVGENELYPSIEEKAAMLLYSIVKNHAFTDGNKRIAAACFLLFLNKNDLLLDEENKQIITNEALASLTLFIAISNSNEMETVKKLILSVLNRR